MLKIEATLTTRQWMRAAKAFRCHLQLPADKLLASQLTAYIDSKMHITLEGPDGSIVDIDPAFIVDVAPKGKRFFLVVETCYEHQAKIGPYLTNMSGEKITVRIAAENQSIEQQLPEAKPSRGDIAPEILKGLHTRWFKNEVFWGYLEGKIGMAAGEIANYGGEKFCKTVFKEHMQVKSCTELSQEAFDTMLHDFNNYVSQR